MALCLRRSGQWMAASALVVAMVASPGVAQVGTIDSLLRAAPRASAVSDTTVVSVSPPRPLQGSILRVIVRPGRPRLAVTRPDSTTGTDSTRRDSTAARAGRADSGLVIRATLFGERLHFEQIIGGDYVAIGALPVDAPASVRVPIIIERPGALPDTAVLEFSVYRGTYRMEKLTVAPAFGRAPDSALAARIAREAALAAEVSAGSHATPRLWSGPFQRPRTSRVTSAFGDGREFNGAVQSRHMGLDLAGAIGEPVLATNRGVVALVGDFYLAGNAVYLDHGAGLVTAYFHLSAVKVAQGDTVAAGQRIGLVGATGRVTGPHLHWVARYGAITVDPGSLASLQVDVMIADVAPVTPPAAVPSSLLRGTSAPLPRLVLPAGAPRVFQPRGGR